MPPTTDELRVSFGRAVRTRRDELGWSQAKLAEAVGVQKETIYRIEKGFGGSHATRVAIANVIEVPIYELLGGAPTEVAS